MTDNVEEEMEEAEDGNANVKVKVDTGEAVDVGFEWGGEPELDGKHWDDAGGQEKAPGSRLLRGEEGAGDGDEDESQDSTMMELKMEGFVKEEAFDTPEKKVSLFILTCCFTRVI